MQFNTTSRKSNLDITSFVNKIYLPRRGVRQHCREVQQHRRGVPQHREK